ncbi:MAG: COG1361 family protein [Vulcanimicrobiaceae bacterium]
MSTTSLTGIFAPGVPALVESLRTLRIEPMTSVGPGETIRATFAFSNVGGASATGVRARFSLPQGVTHIAEADTADERPLDAQERLVDPSGASIGDVEPGVTRHVVCSFRVDDTIEDGTSLVFQAALAANEMSIVATNAERIVVRSRPLLEHVSTLVTLVAPMQPKPGDIVGIRATIVNQGSSSAHDVILRMPVPDHTSYVARSARVAGRLLVDLEGEPFDYDGDAIVAQQLAPGQSVLVEYDTTIDAPLRDGTRIRAGGSVASRECAQFPLESAEIVVHSPVDFEGEETALRVFSDDIVTPGMRVPIALRATNVGTGAADGVSVAFTLPSGLVYAPGSAHVDGHPVADEGVRSLTFSLGMLAAGRSAEVGFAATVAVPEPSAQPQAPITASLRWRSGEGFGQREFARRIGIRVSPRFHRARNYVEADRGTVRAQEDVRFVVHVYNDGTAPEHDVTLRAIPGVFLSDLRIAESPEEPIPYGVPIELGVVHPHAERIFIVLARIASPVPDRSHLTLGAVLEHPGGAVDLGTATIVVRSFPRVEAQDVGWEFVGGEPLRPQRTAEVLIRIPNTGSDVLHDARLTLTVPPELAVERAVNARRERDALLLGDIPSGTTHEARFALRLLRAPKRGTTLALEGRLGGRGISPLALVPLQIPTFAKPEFVAGSAFHVAPAQEVNAGERVFYELRIRNDGDGAAERLTVRVVPTNLAVYVPGSTTINGMLLGDEGGGSPLWSHVGLVLADVTPGIDVRIRWEAAVLSPLESGTQLETRAVLEWDDQETLALAAPILRVAAVPSLGETSAGTPLSIERIFPSPPAPYQDPDAFDEPSAVLPPASVPLASPAQVQPPRAITEVIARSGAVLEASLPPRIAPALPLEQTNSAVAYVDFTAERLVHSIKMLERADAGGLIAHIFALRTLFPEAAVGASPRVERAFGVAARAARAPLERFFVRLRLPRIAVTGKDVEDRESRSALRELLAELLATPPHGDAGVPAGVVRVRGELDLDALRALAAELDGAPLGAVAPWLVNAQLLGSAILHDGSRSDVLGHYRSEMLRVFAVLSELPMEEFHRVLGSSVNRTLDEALAAVLEALRAAARLPVD